jgi:hypothetical protein
MIPNLNTTGASITQDEIDQFGETLPNNILHMPDSGTSTMFNESYGSIDDWTQFIPSAEGDLSSDSITSFSETTDDDVLFYPDQFRNDTVQTIVSIDDIKVGGDAYDYDSFSYVLLKDELQWRSKVNN